MKGKILNKTRVAGAVMLATLGVAAGTAQADSLLAPLVISDTEGGIETYIAMKMKGQGISDQFTADGGKLTSPIHYYHIQKMQGMPGDRNAAAATTPVTNVPDLHTYAHNGGCAVTNTSGHGSSWDMVFQQVTSFVNAANPSGTNTNVNPADQSVGGGWLRQNGVFGDSPFYGMMVIDDVANLASLTGDNGRRDGEGNFSGFAYVVNNASGLMFDYKLLNNPFTKRSGDFKTNWISKTSIDWMWLPATNTRQPNPISPLFVERTAWYTAVTGEGMTLLAEQSGRWDEAVLFTQADQKDAENITSLYTKNGAQAPGAYNNDEQVLSGPKNYSVKCLGLYDRSDFLTTQQFIQTANGGWKRSHIVPVNHSGVDNVKSHGAITYRLDDLNGYQTGNNPAVIGGGPDIGITFNVETSGHLSTSINKSHPNRGY